jgi:GT2 family glycosyltransferase
MEVIVAVDGSTDGTAEYLRSLTLPFPLTVIELENGGAGKARNAAVARAEGRYLAFTEDDVAPDPSWLARAFTVLRNDACDVLEGHTAYPGGDAGVRRFEKDMSASFIPCNLFIRREIFNRVGGYSPEYFDRRSGLYFREDSDLGFRLRDAGARIVIDPALVVIHPLQFQTMAECFRHARRYRFDALLYKRHPRLYRQSIEAKSFGGLTLHRPQHYVALLDVLGLAALVVGLAAGTLPLAVCGLCVVAFCGILFRYKYQGAGWWRIDRVNETLGFSVLPFVYLGALLKGCVRYKVMGVLL